jgi:hypothetical protein
LLPSEFSESPFKKSPQKQENHLSQKTLVQAESQKVIRPQICKKSPVQKQKARNAPSNSGKK